MTLKTAPLGREMIVQGMETQDAGLEAFLFSLGCYTGEPVTVISRRRGSCIVAIKDGRYTIDDQLADAISVY
jgi:ferrous iron transport protein A